MDIKKLKKQLSEEQFNVTQNCSTEKPFNNKYWDNSEDGIYVDIIDGTPLFYSFHKYDSGSGWPSFYKSIDDNAIQSSDDYTLGHKRIELKTKSSKSHLGHLFNDGPNPSGVRYCINSASLIFIKLSDMESHGYGYLIKLFKKNKCI